MYCRTEILVATYWNYLFSILMKPKMGFLTRQVWERNFFFCSCWKGYQKKCWKMVIEFEGTFPESFFTRFFLKFLVLTQFWWKGRNWWTPLNSRYSSSFLLFHFFIIRSLCASQERLHVRECSFYVELFMHLQKTFSETKSRIIKRYYWEVNIKNSPLEPSAH